MIGEIRENNKGTKMIIIAERNKMDIDVEFLDEHHYVKEHTTYTNFKRGQIKNPFDLTVLQIGYLGVGKYNMCDSKGKSLPEYCTWQSMLERCYYEKQKNIHPAYYGENKICEEWKCYQTFVLWYYKNYYDIGKERLHLDKDIKYPGNKVYSPYHCLLVPQSINEQFKRNGHKRTDLDLPYTIHRNGNKFKVSYRSKELGNYNTIEEAALRYETARNDYVKTLVNNYHNMPNYVKEILLNL